MVKVKEQAHILDDGSIDLETWLSHLASNNSHYKDVNLLRNASILSQLAGVDHATETGASCLQQGLAMAEILAELELDQEALAAAIVYDSVHYADLSLDDISEQLGSNVSKLVRGVLRMDLIHYVHGSNQQHNLHQIDNIRKMLLAMVDDVRVVLIKLAERLQVLRSAKHLSTAMQQHIAREIMQIYAPLANRLGVGQIKWEMEDRAFQLLQPDTYKEIASGLKSRRVERDRYVNNIVVTLREKIAELGISNFDVYGRSKHIHSIYKKMQRKKVPIEEIYDATAVRVLVDSNEHCYSVLGLTHNLWQAIAEEFDDYIQVPKANGYRSLHTAVVGPEQRVFEVQIRTFTMHDEAELGVAAHWKYKESPKSSKASHESKIEWLREVLAWQKDLAASGQVIDPAGSEYLDDRVYVFTPGGDIIDLPAGATALDFAYTIHSEVGHRCRGSKVNGKIAQLTQPLHTGDQVEILTAKQGKPSRDWLNPHLGYLKTSRAKAKVMHWFKQLDFDKHLELGKDLFEKEVNKLGLSNLNLLELAKHFNFKQSDDFFAAMGRQDLRIGQVLHYLQAQQPQLPDIDEESLIAQQITSHSKTDHSHQSASGVHIQGVGDLLTYMAKCCQPLPGDSIIGYITQGRGISIHKHNCNNIVYANEHQQKRLIEVNWANEQQHHYPADVTITAYDRHGLLRDITALLSSEHASVANVATQLNKAEHIAKITLTLEVSSLNRLSRLIDKLSQIANVIEVKRIQ